MWARIIEFILACWLALSSFIMQAPLQEASLRTNNLVCAFLVALFALLSFWKPLKNVHLLTLGVALWLWGLGYSAFPELPLPVHENGVIVGLLLLMLAIVPSSSSRLSPSWEKFIQKRMKN